MEIKRRAVEVQFSNGETLIVHEPAMRDLGKFLRALPSLNAIGRAFRAADEQAEGVMGVPLDIPDSAIEGIFPLFGVMCDMAAEDFRALPLWDGMGVLRAFGEFVPNQAATEGTDSEPSGTLTSPSAVD